jgi:hypothetical protein
MSRKNRAGQFRIRLQPQRGGAFTHVRASGSVPMAVPAWQLERLMQALCFWSGWPVEPVSPAEVETVVWFEWWGGTLADIRPEHLQLRCIARRRSTEGECDG